MSNIPTEKNNMTQAIKNILSSFAFDKVEAILAEKNVVTPEILDQWESDLHSTMKENDQKIGKARIRELLVAYILSEFNTDAFGVPTNAWTPGEISDTAIRKMKNQRKKKFVDLKIVKAAK